MKKRLEFSILTGVAFIMGFILYGMVGILSATDFVWGGIENVYIRVFLMALLGGYFFFSILSGIMFTAKWLSEKTLQGKIILVVVFFIPVWLAMAGAIYSIPYGIYNVIQYRKLEKKERKE